MSTSVSTGFIKHLTKGLSLPIQGAPDQGRAERRLTSHVAIVGDDYWTMKPTFHVKEGDFVKKGQKLFSDKKSEGVHYTSPVSGTITHIYRGDRRVFQSLVIRRDGEAPISFPTYKGPALSSYTAEDLKAFLLESGLWTALRTRPLNRVARPTEKPSSIFVTATDSNPLALDPLPIIFEARSAFKKGVDALLKLAGVPVHLCARDIDAIRFCDSPGTVHHVFTGPHPSGNVGTHIHFIDPVSEKKCVWHIGYQDVIALGQLLETGELHTLRHISLCGPLAAKPRAVITHQGASVSEIIQGEVLPGTPHRSISGSVFGGRTATGPFDFLGRYHLQVTLIQEGAPREFMGWHMPGTNKFSVKNVFVAKLMPWVSFPFSTTTHGSPRSLVPIGSFEKVMPMDILPTQLLRALLSKDLESAIKLGVLDLDEEDLALCTFVDPCKHEFGPVLRNVFETYLKEEAPE